jgi:hypothetical protein
MDERRGDEPRACCLCDSARDVGFYFAFAVKRLRLHTPEDLARLREALERSPAGAWLCGACVKRGQQPLPAASAGIGLPLFPAPGQDKYAQRRRANAARALRRKNKRARQRHYDSQRREHKRRGLAGLVDALVGHFSWRGGSLAN